MPATPREANRSRNTARKQTSSAILTDRQLRQIVVAVSLLRQSFVDRKHLNVYNINLHPVNLWLGSKLKALSAPLLSPSRPPGKQAGSRLQGFKVCSFNVGPRGLSLEESVQRVDTCRILLRQGEAETWAARCNTGASVCRS